MSDSVCDAVYRERNLVLALLTTYLPVGSCYRYQDTSAELGWRNVIHIELPLGEGQLSWHIPDRELMYFEHLPESRVSLWDGHSTDEKYRRIIAHIKQLYNY